MIVVSVHRVPILSVFHVSLPRVELGGAGVTSSLVFSWAFDRPMAASVGIFYPKKKEVGFSWNSRKFEFLVESFRGLRFLYL